MMSKAERIGPTNFYSLSLTSEREGDSFYEEYNFLLKTVEAVNSFNSLYKTGRRGAKGGPSTHAQQDLYRAMLIFACAGLDVFVKQLVKTKLSRIITVDKDAANKFKEYVKRGLTRDSAAMTNTVALALIDPTPRNVFLNEYIDSMSGESLQSVDQLCRVSDASGLKTKQIFDASKLSALREAFIVRNQIIHEMDINVSPEATRTSGYRTRRQRVSRVMERHTKAILDLAEELFRAFKSKFEEFKIDTAKG